MCPHCQCTQIPRNRGSYIRPSDGKKIKRFKCLRCHRSFSENAFGIEYRLRKRDVNQSIFRILCTGVSQRACAFLMRVDRGTIARRVDRFGACAQNNLAVYRQSRPKATAVLIDEMESFEHTKCKPLTMPIAVEEKTRKILSVGVGRIAAKGHLAAISRAKYGPRVCERKKSLTKMLNELKSCVSTCLVIKSDESHHYPGLIRNILAKSTHISFKGQRGCVVGQGELKAVGFDPLFSLNHTYAMIRDNIKRLSRRTWCTTKRPDKLELLLGMYAWFHNLKLDLKPAEITLTWNHVTN